MLNEITGYVPGLALHIISRLTFKAYRGLTFRGTKTHFYFCSMKLAGGT